MKYTYLLTCLLIIGLLACTKKVLPPQAPLTELPKGVYRVMDHKQNLSGNADTGFHYLTHGGYIGSGIPLGIFEKRLKDFEDTVLNRSGVNKKIPHDYIAFTTSTGAKVVSGNCFSCHAGKSAIMNGKVDLSMGGEINGFQSNLERQWKVLSLLSKRAARKSPEQLASFKQYNQWFQPALPYVRTENPYVNPAFRLEEAYAMHRNPVDLSYDAKGVFEMAGPNIASDVPPLWHVKKKGALYYNGMGRGDYSKLLMQASTQGIKDSAEAREIQKNFVDVVAWLYTLEAPKFPGEIDKQLARRGEEIFTSECEKCHGTYGRRPYYPNKIVPLDEIKTDPLYAQYLMQQSNISKWYNESWYSQSFPKSELKPSAGYMAPPLDGVWATAPYFHNASVPSLLDVLNSKERPTYWYVGSSNKGLDYEIDDKIGLDYRVEVEPKQKNIYNTNIPGYGNQGHEFGDNLSEIDRRAVIEYLKTL